MELTLIQKIVVFALPVIFAITLHEAAHGYVARFFGDMTAAAAGRITANPLKHIDLVGTILVPLVILLTSKLLGGGMILFGWAKPVPVNFGRLRRPKQDMLWVALAGPGMNFIMAVFWALMIQLGHALGSSFVSAPLMLMGAAGVFINVILMALNLIPLPPLDGGRIAVSLLPVKQAMQFARLEPYGLFILLGLMFVPIGGTTILGFVLWPLISVFIGLTALVTGLEPAQLVGLIQLVLS
ncbi:MAG: site-2 protease family protein [Thiobacillus sp.]|uniref:site-2 protease family protein n=1 Tax=unclassified Thiobacillus TaxID=2646513 RepID=UPI00086A8B5C|nr:MULTISPECIES: site-2 protease family protein [unclassified Thiobacillus]ODU42908.1 MAG: peptidase M50 [Thiobacillus sp. SCN 63-374]MBN8770499.1 site-2 protease family protein [Thiobacillus sp.]MBN8780600.1 site-2 protease family protein [Thiobacillus sp.]ODV01701.1 MAG: peptidase M50 [Thiobacillus sp. SCN 63-57]OJY57768.1 MAG: site-2 protease family protein [Thiobacillus sp. 0-1251]